MKLFKSLLAVFVGVFVIVSCSSKPVVENHAAGGSERQPDSVHGANQVIGKMEVFESKIANDRYFTMDGYKIPLHVTEKIPDSEPKAIMDLNDIMVAFFKKQYADGGPTKDPATGITYQGTRRGVHPRGHGCAVGALKVNPNLDRSVGIFQAGAEYKVTIRFSNGSPKINGDDRSIDTRGFAMKVHNVTGKHILGNESLLTNESMSQDFTLNSSVPFFSDDAAHYRDFMEILSLKSESLEDAGEKFLIQLLKQGQILPAARITKAFTNIRSVKASNPLGISYYSITPFQHGLGPGAEVVKYKVKPCAGEWQEPVDPNDKFFLRSHLVKHLKSKPACFSFMVQSQIKDWKFKVEDPSYTWSEKKSAFHEIAKVLIPQQELMDDLVCEKLVINPWNAIQEHKPLGGINRIRLPTYLMSVKKRKETNKY